MESIQELKIPLDRVGVLVGEKGKIKREIQKAFDVKLKIDSEEGEVEITGEDGYNVYRCLSVVKAIGRGFNPEDALLLLKEDYGLEVVNIPDFCGKSKNDLFRIRARVIGKEGKFRKKVEEMTNCKMIVYGKTVSLIGEIEDLAIAKRAVENILRGSPHSNVIRFMEESIAERKKNNALFYEHTLKKE